MENEPSGAPKFTECVCEDATHAVTASDWSDVATAGKCGTALADVYQVAVAGVGGTATGKGNLHGVVAVASSFGNAITGNGGVAISSGGVATAEAWAIAYAKNGKAVAAGGGVAVTVGGYAIGGENAVGIGWTGSASPAKVLAGPGGVAIGDAGTLVKAGAGGVLIAMAAPRKAPDKTPATKISRVGEDGIDHKQWYKIELDGNDDFQFTATEDPVAWIAPTSPCPKPPKPESVPSALQGEFPTTDVHE